MWSKRNWSASTSSRSRADELLRVKRRQVRGTPAGDRLRRRAPRPPPRAKTCPITDAGSTTARSSRGQPVEPRGEQRLDRRRHDERRARSPVATPAPVLERAGPVVDRASTASARRRAGCLRPRRRCARATSSAMPVSPSRFSTICSPSAAESGSSTRPTAPGRSRPGRALSRAGRGARGRSTGSARLAPSRAGARSDRGTSARPSGCRRRGRPAAVCWRASRAGAGRPRRSPRSGTARRRARSPQATRSATSSSPPRRRARPASPRDVRRVVVVGSPAAWRDGLDAAART